MKSLLNFINESSKYNDLINKINSIIKKKDCKTIIEAYCNFCDLEDLKVHYVAVCSLNNEDYDKSLKSKEDICEALCKLSDKYDDVCKKLIDFLPFKELNDFYFVIK